MAMGLSNAAQSFQRYIQHVLQDIPNIYIYLDDILLYNTNKEEHKRTLETVLSRLDDAGLTLALDKCVFGQEQIEFLGFHVNQAGLTPLKEKLEAINKIPPPETQKKLLAFLGAVSYYRHCLPPLNVKNEKLTAAEVLQPLYTAATSKLPPKQKFKDYWEEHKLSSHFENAKQLLNAACRLTYPDPALPLAITADASQKAIGCVLEQHDGKQWRPLAFFSKHLDKARQRWTTFRRELYALHQGVRYFHKQFGGRAPILFTDHKALCGSFGNPNLQTHDPIAHNQIVELGQWTSDIRYLPARSNPVSDFLSRPPEMVEEVAIDEIPVASVQALQEQITIQQVADAQRDCKDTFSHRNGLCPRNTKFNSVNFGNVEVFCETTNKPRPILPANLRHQAMRQYHCIDHCGADELTRRCAENFYWATLKKDCKLFRKFCHGCQSATPTRTINPPIGNFPVPAKKFSEIHVDVVGPLPKSKNMSYLLTAVCRSSRLTEAIPMEKADAKSVAEAFISGWLQRYGACSRIYSDNGNTFQCDLWKELNKKLGIEVKFVPPFHQATNGAVERTHQSIKTSLKAALVEIGDTKREHWMDYLPFVMLGRRISLHNDMGCSPAEVAFGEPLVIPGALTDPSAPDNKNIRDIIQNVQQSVNRKPTPTSKHRQEPVYFPESINTTTHVYLKVQDGRSLMPKYVGPMLIVDRPTKSTIKIKVGTYADGRDRVEEHHWQNCRPAFVGPDTPLHQKPALGRPARPTPSAPPPQLTLPVVDEPDFPENQQQIDTNQPAEIPAPNFELINDPPQSPHAEPPESVQTTGPPPEPPFSASERPVRTNRNVPHPKFADYYTYQAWSASKNELDYINASISRTP